MRALPATLLTAAIALAITPAAHADTHTPGESFTAPMFGDRSETLWPLEVGVEILALSPGAGHAKTVIPLRQRSIADGQHFFFTEVVDTPRGQRSFRIEVVARYHGGDKIELEYDLVVRQARFAELTWGDYLLHRLALGPRPELGPEVLAAARADIVETVGEVHGRRFSVDGDLYEIRLQAKSMRG